MTRRSGGGALAGWLVRAALCVCVFSWLVDVSLDMWRRAAVLIPKMASQEAFPHYRFPNSQFPIKSQAIAKPLIRAHMHRDSDLRSGRICAASNDHVETQAKPRQSSTLVNARAAWMAAYVSHMEGRHFGDGFYGAPTDWGLLVRRRKSRGAS